MGNVIFRRIYDPELPEPRDLVEEWPSETTFDPSFLAFPHIETIVRVEASNGRAWYLITGSEGFNVTARLLVGEIRNG